MGPVPDVAVYRFEKYKARSCDELSGHLHAQLAWVRSQFSLDEFAMIKIFTSGSFFDPAEVPAFLFT